jgi:hypothetical protein
MRPSPTIYIIHTYIHTYIYEYMRFEVIVAVQIKNKILCDVTVPSTKVYGGTF